MCAVGQVPFIGRNKTQPGLYFIPMELRYFQHNFFIPAPGFPYDVDAFIQCFTIHHQNGFVETSG